MTDEQRRDDAGETERGGAANMPPFGEPAAVRTAADHQITDGEAMTQNRTGTHRMGDSATDGDYTAASGTGGRREDALTSAMHRFADRIEGASDALRGFGAESAEADDQRSRISGPAQDAADRLDQISGYLHDRDARELRRDVEGQIRARPLQAALVGLAAGWVVGKIIK